MCQALFKCWDTVVNKTDQNSLSLQSGQTISRLMNKNLVCLKPSGGGRGTEKKKGNLGVVIIGRVAMREVFLSRALKIVRN